MILYVFSQSPTDPRARTPRLIKSKFTTIFSLAGKKNTSDVY